MKVCSECKIEKEKSKFYKNKTMKDGLSYVCKKCQKKYCKTERYKECLKKYRKSKKYKEYQKKYRASEKEKEKRRIYQKSEKYRAYLKKYRQSKKHKKYQNKYNKEYRQSEKGKEAQKKYKRTSEHHKKYQREYQKKYQVKYSKLDKSKKRVRNQIRNKRINNIQFRLSCILRDRLRHALKNNQKVGSAVKDLGCSIQELKIYLENQFKDGMTWENYGKISRKNPNIWNIDHIKPVSIFDLTNREQFLEAFNYKNLQPLWAFENLSKKNKYNGNFFKSKIL